VTGANRGLGFEFCRQYAAEGWDVLACCRHPEKAGKLTHLVNVRLLGLDLQDFAEIDRLAKELKDDKAGEILKALATHPKLQNTKPAKKAAEMSN
jgi:NAD(P)-dependent dehydrogenase (short-subunit alcohol dehydrogenase family)